MGPARITAGGEDAGRSGDGQTDAHHPSGISFRVWGASHFLWNRAEEHGVLRDGYGALELSHGEQATGSSLSKMSAPSSLESQEGAGGCPSSEELLKGIRIPPSPPHLLPEVDGTQTVHSTHACSAQAPPR